MVVILLFYFDGVTLQTPNMHFAKIAGIDICYLLNIFQPLKAIV